MSETSFLWPTTGSGDVSPHSVVDTAAIFAAMGVPTGANAAVVPSQLNELVPVISGTNILVGTGWAIVDGHPYRNSTQKTVTPALPTTGVTGRRLVLRTTWASGTQTTPITEISSADGPATIPTMTQRSGVTYDAPICSYTVANGSGVIAAFTDNRSFIGANPSITTMRNLGGGTLSAPSGISGTGRVTILDFRPIAGAQAADDPTAAQVAIAGNMAMYRSSGGGVQYAMTAGRLMYVSTVTAETAGIITGYYQGNSGVNINLVVAPARSPWMRCRFNPTNAGNANSSTRVLGFIDATSGATPNGAYLRRNTTGDLYFVTRQGGAETATSLGAQTSAQRWYDIYSPDAGVTWYCYDHTGVLLATHTTNVPTAATNLAVGTYITSTSGNLTDHVLSAIVVSMIDE